MIQVDIPQGRDWDNDDYRNTMNRARELSDAYHLSPKQVYDQIATKKGPFF
jgi:hypothetical protein